VKPNTLSDELVNKLKENPLANIQCLGFIKNIIPTFVKEVRNTIIVKGTSDHEWTYVCANAAEDFSYLQPEFSEKDQYFFTNNTEIKNFLINNLGCKIFFEAVAYYYPEHAVSFKETEIMEPVKPGDADIIWDNSEYKEVMDLSYIKDRITNGISAGIYNGGKLVSWSLTHDDNSIGFLHTIEAERKKGYALNIVANMTRQTLDKNEIPFVQISENNIKSYSLVVKLGYKRLGNSFWLYR